MKILSSPSTIILSSTSSLFPLSPSHPPPPQCRRRGASPSIPSFPFPGPGKTLRLLYSQRRSSTAKNNEVQHQSAEEGIGLQNKDEPAPEEDIKLLAAVRSIYNEIMILETPESRLLLLDSSHNVHSVFTKGGKKWTGSYWDEFATLPPIIPDGPVAIFGLGGGTAADLLLHLWPALQIQGWEIDEVLIHKCREYLGLSELEKRREAERGLEVRIGDALSADASVAGGYAGIIVDLFAEGKVLGELEEVKTWVEIGEKLMPKGRIMVNCGGVGVSTEGHGEELLLLESGWEQNNAIRAMREAFPGAGELNWKLMPEDKGANFLALTGALPDDLAAWSSALPDELRSSVYQWRICWPS